MVFSHHNQSADTQTVQIPAGIPEVLPFQNPDETREQNGGGFVTAIEGAALAAVVGPLNEAARFGAFAVAQKSGLDPAIVGGVFGGTTFLVEGVTSVLSADLLDRPAGKKVTEKASKIFAKVGIGPDAKLNTVIKSGVALIGGSAVVQVLKKREEPELPKKETMKYGLKTAAAMAGYFTVQGYFMSKGIDTPSPVNIGVGVAAFGGTLAAAPVVKRKMSKQGKKA